MLQDAAKLSFKFEEDTIHKREPVWDISATSLAALRHNQPTLGPRCDFWVPIRNLYVALMDNYNTKDYQLPDILATLVKAKDKDTNYSLFQILLKEVDQVQYLFVRADPTIGKHSVNSDGTGGKPKGQSGWQASSSDVRESGSGDAWGNYKPGSSSSNWGGWSR